MKKFFLLTLIMLILLFGSFLKFYRLTSVPPALHGDELGAGYNAWSLLTTGKDEYGKTLPFTFRNDFSPLIFYATIPVVSWLGLNEISTKLPTAVVGALTLPVIYLLVCKVFKDKKLALLIILLIAFSSWQIRFSRLALEMAFALFFQTIAILLFLKAIPKNIKLLFSSFIFFGLSVISYQSAKITTPLLILGLTYLYGHALFSKYKKLFTSSFVIFIALPIIVYFFARPFHEMRFVGISVFTVWKNSFPSGTKLLSAKPIADLSFAIISNYLKHFDPNLLFFDNSHLRYFQLDKFGLFYPWQIPFIIIGILNALKQIRFKHNQFFLFWLLIAPIPAALTTGVPYANIGRNLLMFPAIELFCAQGIIWTGKIILKHNKYLTVVFFIIFTTISVIYFHQFLYQYFVVSPENYAFFWGKPFKDAMPVVVENEFDTRNIIITDHHHQAYMYLLFYGNKTPLWLAGSQKIRDPIVGYSNIANYEFRAIDWKKDKNLQNALLLGTVKEIPDDVENIIQEFKGENNEIQLRLVKTAK